METTISSPTSAARYTVPSSAVSANEVMFALAFRGFLIMVCVGIYAVLINGMIVADNIPSALFLSLIHI